MVSFDIGVNQSMLSISKRMSREYALGYLSKEEFEKFINIKKEIDKIVDASLKRHKERDGKIEN